MVVEALVEDEVFEVVNVVEALVAVDVPVGFAVDFVVDFVVLRDVVLEDAGAGPLRFNAHLTGYAD